MEFNFSGFDWKLFVATFSTIFVAELGDKTQIAAIALSSQSRSGLEVLLGVVLALTLAGGLGVVMGSLLSNWISPVVLQKVSGVLFLGFGLWILLKGNA